MPLTREDVYYIQNNPDKVFNVIDGLTKWMSGAATVSVIPSVSEVTIAEAEAGAKIEITIQLNAGGDPIQVGDFQLSASVSDTIADSDTTPTISSSTPKLSDGRAKIVLTLPEEGTYGEGETITVTIQNATAPDGRTITGGNCVITIVANPETEE